MLGVSLVCLAAFVPASALLPAPLTTHAAGSAARPRVLPATAIAVAGANDDVVASDKHRLACRLAVLAGATDVVGFARWGVFTNMMTGHTLNAAVAVAARRAVDVGFCVSTIACYVAGVVSYRIADLELDSAPAALAPVVFALLVTVDQLCAPARFGLRFRWAVPILAAAFGIVNSASNEEAAAITCMLTGHFTKVTVHLTNVASRRPAAAAQARAAQESARVILSFVVGAVGAASAKAATAAGVFPAGLPTFSAIGAAYAAVLLRHSRRARRRLEIEAASEEPCEVDALNTVCE